MQAGDATGFPSGELALLPRRIGGVIPDLAGLSPSLGRMGALEVRLAVTKKEVREAQRLRYKIFYDQGSAIPDRTAALIRRDVCRFDSVCDHLLVIDHQGLFGPNKPKIVGTYRLLRQEVAERNFGFYSADEYDIAPLLARQADKRFLELGRSCVLPEYRGKRTVELLWQGIWAYVRHHRVDVMFGCASLEGTSPSHQALALSFLHHHARAPEEWRARAQAPRYVAMDFLSKEAIELRKALAVLPPLLKGYLRLGATFGDGAVVDHQFGTTDVLVVLPVAGIEARYTTYFGQTAERRAA
jgi:putative hemolysin